MFVIEQTPALCATTTGVRCFLTLPTRLLLTELLMSKYAPLAPHGDASSCGPPGDDTPRQRLDNGAVELRRLVAERFVTSAWLLAVLLGASLMAL